MPVGSRFGTLLQEIPLHEWKISKFVTLGWFDGTTYGVCSMAEPNVAFEFSQIAELFRGSATLRRLYLIREISSEVVDRIQALLDANPEQSLYALGPQVDELLAVQSATHLLFESDKEGSFSDWWYTTLDDNRGSG